MVGTSGSWSAPIAALSHATTPSMSMSNGSRALAAKASSGTGWGRLPTLLTAVAPSEWPARPRRSASTRPRTGFASESRNSSASSVPSTKLGSCWNGTPGQASLIGAPSHHSEPSGWWPKVSDWPWPWTS